MNWAIAIDPIALLVFGGVAFKVVRRFDKKLGQFNEDWSGTPERPGVPARAGVMERLSLIEVAQVDTRSEVAEIHKKLVQKGI